MWLHFSRRICRTDCRRTGKVKNISVHTVVQLEEKSRNFAIFSIRTKPITAKFLQENAVILKDYTRTFELLQSFPVLPSSLVFAKDKEPSFSRSVGNISTMTEHVTLDTIVIIFLYIINVVCPGINKICRAYCSTSCSASMHTLQRSILLHAEEPKSIIIVKGLKQKKIVNLWG